MRLGNSFEMEAKHRRKMSTFSKLPSMNYILVGLALNSTAPVMLYCICLLNPLRKLASAGPR
jgi:hypothetical protein